MTPPTAQITRSLGRPAPECLACGAPLGTTAKHDSRVVRGETEEEVARQDFCPECREAARAGDFHSRWLAKRPAPPPPPRRETRRAQIERLRKEFARLSDLDEPAEADLDFQYLVAHMLMKTGGFKWIETDDEAGVLIFEDVQERQRRIVQCVPLDPDRLGAAQSRLNELL